MAVLESTFHFTKEALLLTARLDSDGVLCLGECWAECLPVTIFRLILCLNVSVTKSLGNLGEGTKEQKPPLSL